MDLRNDANEKQHLSFPDVGCIRTVWSGAHVHLSCSVCVCVCVCVCTYLNKINVRSSLFFFFPGWSGSPMSRDLCRSSSCLKTHSHPTQLHRELSNKYPYWAVDQWHSVHWTDSDILVVFDHLITCSWQAEIHTSRGGQSSLRERLWWQQLYTSWFNVHAGLCLSLCLSLSLSVSLCLLYFFVNIGMVSSFCQVCF